MVPDGPSGRADAMAHRVPSGQLVWCGLKRNVLSSVRTPKNVSPYAGILRCGRHEHQVETASYNSMTSKFV